LNSRHKEEKEKRDVSASVWMGYISITVLGLNIVDRSVMQVKKTINIDADPSINLIFLCSPGRNPAGTLASILAALDYEPFKGIVVTDESYIDFSEPGINAASLVAEYVNICVMQTLSKSFGLAATRCRLTSHFPPQLFLTLFQRRLSMAIAQPLISFKYEGIVQHLRSHSPLRALSPASLSTMCKKKRNAQGITG
jgi:hypothetical protein